MYLETSTAEVSSGRARPGKPKSSPFEEAARKDSAVHVSLSSDSPVKQPGNLAASTFRTGRKADEA
jgi:hypothetical protein